MLKTVESWQQPNEPPFPPDQTAAFDWTARLSIDAIRSHTKTDDVPGVTDEQLSLYRAASLEAAEMYTGLLLKGSRTVTEPIQGPSPGRLNRQNIYWDKGLSYAPKLTYPYRLKYPVADGYVYLYGGPSAARKTFIVPIGSRVIQVPIVTGFIDLSNCCDPHSSHHPNGGMMAAYKAGFACADDVPSGVVLGCLMYIAWVVQHPGDELLTQRNRLDRAVSGSSGTNNIAMVSGAIEQWRQYDDSAA